MLQSAKENLMTMATFGLTEFQRETQLLFEDTFNIKYINDTEQRKSTHANSYNLTEEERQQIINLTYLDIELYKFAKQIFMKRLAKFKQITREEV